MVLAACPSGNAPQSKPSTQGQNTVSHTAPKPKATVALALGGGASKGFAHIGIIKGFERKQYSGQNRYRHIRRLYCRQYVRFGNVARPPRIGSGNFGVKPILVDLTLSTSGFIKAKNCKTTSTAKSATVRCSSSPIKFCRRCDRF